VKLVPATVATAVLILPLPERFGTYNKTLPLAKSKSRAPSPKLKTVFAPSRVNVRSVKVSSARESLPVRTAAPGLTLSFTEAGRGGVRHEQEQIVNYLSNTSFLLLGRNRECSGPNRNSTGEENPDETNSMAKPFRHNPWNL